MKAERFKAETFVNVRDSSQRLTVRTTAWGEPYIEGAQVDLQDGDDMFAVFLDKHELGLMHDWLGRLLGRTP